MNANSKAAGVEKASMEEVSEGAAEMVDIVG
jgi:hypothetical protein